MERMEGGEGGGVAGLVLTALVHVIEAWWEQCGKNDCSVVQQRVRIA